MTRRISPRPKPRGSGPMLNIWCPICGWNFITWGDWFGHLAFHKDVPYEEPEVTGEEEYRHTMEHLDSLFVTSRKVGRK